MPTYGRIITVSEADTDFGQPSESYQKTSQHIHDLCNICKGYIMFRIANGKAAIANQNRIPLDPSDATIASTDVFSVYSVSVLEELLSQGSNIYTQIQMRGTTLCVRNGQKIMEYGQLCPPICPTT